MSGFKLLRENAKAGALIKILWIGDSIASGTSSYAGPRDHAHALFAKQGWNIDNVGSLTTQNGNLSEWTARDYDHDGVSGETIAQITTRIDDRCGTYTPDLVIVIGGNNDVGVTAEATIKANTIALIAAARSTHPGVPIVIVGLHPRNSSGSISMDANFQAAHRAMKEACSGQTDVLYVNLHTAWSRRWSAEGFIDSTHCNNLGYYFMAREVVKQVVGPDWVAYPAIPTRQTEVTSVAADIEYAEGAYVTCAGASVLVMTPFGGGANVTITFGTDWPLSTRYGPIQKIEATGSSLTGSVTAEAFEPGVLI